MANELHPEYLALLRRMTGEEKLLASFRLYWAARELKAVRLRELHPDWTERQIQDRVKEIFLHASS